MKQYAVEWCLIIDEQCEYDDCNDCPNNQPTSTEHEDNLLECEFMPETIMVDKLVPCKVNRSNVLAKTHVCDEVNQFIKKHNLKPTKYSPANLKQYLLFFMLKRTIGLGVPDKIYANKDKVCVIRYGDVVYLIAPRIENK